MERKKMFLAILLISLPLVISEALLPFMLCSLLKFRVGKILHTEQVSVMVEQRPALMLLGGRVKKLEIQVKDVKMDKLYIKELSLLFQNADIPFDALVNGDLKNDLIAKKIDIEAIITADDIGKSIAQEIGIEQKSIAVTISEGVVDIKIAAPLMWENNLLQSVKGKFEITESGLVLRISGIKGMSLPLVVISKEKLPWKVKIADVIAAENQIRILFKNSNRDIRREKVE